MLKLSLKDFEHYLARCEMSTPVRWFEQSWHHLSLGLKWKLTFACGHQWAFQICWHIEDSTLTVTSFRTLNSCWNSITSIRFVHIMLLDAHLTSHPRMSGSRWVTAWLCLFRSLRSLFAQFFSVILLPLLYLFCLLGPGHLCPLLRASLHNMFCWYLQYSWRDR